jgi:hypothetical protein
VLFLTPSSPSATFTATITALPAPDHNLVWYDLDVAAFPKGGTLAFEGQVGPSGCEASSSFTDQCATVAPTGSTPVLWYQANVPPGTAWSFQYQFPPGTDVLHFGAEGNWSSPTGSTNTNTVTVSVQ